MRVIICEDDISQRQFILNEIVQYANFHLPGTEVVLCASSGAEVLSYINQYPADCYFLDIDLEGIMCGLELASLIREKDSLANIIFVTMFADKLRLTFKYKIAAMDYIVKDPDKEIFQENLTLALNTAYQRYVSIGQQSDRVNMLQIKVGENIKNIKYANIYYLETATVAHKLRLHTKDGTYEFYGKLKDYEKLDSRFRRCHNSYLINIDYMIEFSPKERMLTMSNGHKCLVSFRYTKNITRVN
ncbi:response regulator transcription factor [Lysinibacillus sphaericus]|uniref:Response regulator n=2 Tax=Lysinibacillus TaxID=400634 RepID=A0A2S0K327_LYSSH|nr:MULTISPECIES: LytTR family DNA-binding domain-containing protein [Lysinibacillus]AHN24005.1 hypothetical protein T479_06270 [Lysinibacillus varians]AVK97780.1 DNA-binding response regulator [Lysinibacillus sphaericus]MCS1382776.1 LytTR family DNA-binding domain-containing protein [Lysinibacillus sphaericus]MED4543266.1 LytTR family DNA-binding domain-containing protein [Lysinibacillus sphaericus]TKI21013.1 response regulator transcription factor [Lysinibacillus sphaericus]